MKQNLFNKLWLRVGMIVAIMTTALSGTAWADTEVTYNFSEIEGFSDWTTSYSQHVVSYNEATVTFASANHQTSTITDIPVTKGGAVELALNNDYSSYALKSATFTCRQWGSKAQTITLHYSTDGGNTYTSTGVTSTNFTISSSSLPEGTNAVKITFNSTSNQVGIASATITYAPNTSSAVATTTTIDATGITNTDVYTSTAAGSLSASVAETASGNAVAGATVTWSGNNDDVATIDASTGAITLVGAGSVTFTATYAGVSGSYLGSSATYVMTVTDSTPFTGGDVTFVAGTDLGTTSANNSPDEVTKSVVTMSSTDAAFATAQYRFYKDSETTISTSQGTITSIVFTQSGDYNVSNFSANTGSYDNGTWTGNVASVVFTASAQVRASQIVVTVDLGATSDPVINANDVNITYDATSGTIGYNIDNPVTGTTLTASTTDTWLTLGDVTSSSVPFTCSANDGSARTATVTLTYGTITKDVTITQAGAPESYTTIPDLFEAATTTETSVYVTFNNWVVSGVSTNGKNVFVTDNNGNGFVIYSSNDQSSTYAVGNILSGTAVSCSLKKYNGFAELLNVNATDLTITTGGTVSVANVALANLAGVNTGALVSYENLTCSIDNNKYYLSDGTTTLQVFNSLFAFDALEAGKVYNITGVYQQFNSTKEILPRSAADIEEVEAPVQTTVTAGTLSHVEISDLYDGDMEDITLGDNVAVGTLVYFSLNVTEGYTLESVTVLDASNNEVTLTENQGSWSFTMPNSSVTINATATASSVTPKTLTNANIVAAGAGASGYQSWTITDSNGKTWNAYAVKNQHSNATSAYHYLQIKKYASNTASYLQVPEYGTKITSITMTVSGASKPMDGGGNAVTLYFSDSNSTAAAGEGVVSGTGASEVTIDCSSLNLNTGYITASGAVRIWDVTVEYEDAEPITVTLNASGYATFASTKAIDFTDATDYTAWQITGVNEGAIIFAPITGAVAAGTGVLLKGTESQEITLTEAETGTDISSTNKLVGFTVATNVQDNQYYGLKNDKFVKVNAGQVPAGKALLPATVVHPSGNGVKSLTFVFDDDATGISTVESFTEEGAIYNVAGQRLNKMQKGINIVNGKKILK